MSERLQPHFEAKKRLAVASLALGVMALALLGCGGGTPIEKINKPITEKPPAFSITTKNKTTFNFYAEDQSDWKPNQSGLQTYLDEKCKNGTVDKEIPVYFTNEMSCGADGEIGCSNGIGTDNASIEIHDTQIEKYLTEYPNHVMEQCENRRFLTPKNKLQCTDNDFTTRDPIKIANSAFVHEIRHICGLSRNEDWPNWESLSWLQSNPKMLFIK